MIPPLTRSINLNIPHTFSLSRLTAEQAEQRLRILEAVSTQYPLTPRSARERTELANALSANALNSPPKKEGFTVRIVRQEVAQFYYVEFVVSSNTICIRRFRELKETIDTYTSRIPIGTPLEILSAIVKPPEGLGWYSTSIEAKIYSNPKNEFLQMIIGHLHLILANHCLQKILVNQPELYACSLELDRTHKAFYASCAEDLLRHSQLISKAMMKISCWLSKCFESNDETKEYLSKINQMAADEALETRKLFMRLDQYSRRLVETMDAFEKKLKQTSKPILNSFESLHSTKILAEDHLREYTLISCPARRQIVSSQIRDLKNLKNRLNNRNCKSTFSSIADAIDYLNDLLYKIPELHSCWLQIRKQASVLTFAQTMQALAHHHLIHDCHEGFERIQVQINSLTEPKERTALLKQLAPTNEKLLSLHNSFSNQARRKATLQEYVSDAKSFLDQFYSDLCFDFGIHNICKRTITKEQARRRLEMLEKQPNLTPDASKELEQLIQTFSQEFVPSLVRIKVHDDKFYDIEFSSDQRGDVEQFFEVDARIKFLNRSSSPNVWFTDILTRNSLDSESYWYKKGLMSHASRFANENFENEVQQDYQLHLGLFSVTEKLNSAGQLFDDLAEIPETLTRYYEYNNPFRNEVMLKQENSRIEKFNTISNDRVLWLNSRIDLHNKVLNLQQRMLTLNKKQQKIKKILSTVLWKYSNNLEINLIKVSRLIETNDSKIELSHENLNKINCLIEQFNIVHDIRSDLSHILNISRMHGLVDNRTQLRNCDMLSNFGPEYQIGSEICAFYETLGYGVSYIKAIETSFHKHKDTCKKKIKQSNCKDKGWQALNLLSTANEAGILADASLSVRKSLLEEEVEFLLELVSHEPTGHLLGSISEVIDYLAASLNTILAIHGSCLCLDMQVSRLGSASEQLKVSLPSYLSRAKLLTSHEPHIPLPEYPLSFVRAPSPDNGSGGYVGGYSGGSIGSIGACTIS